MTTNGSETPEQLDQPEDIQPQPPELQSERGDQSSGGIFGIPTKWLLIGGGGGGGVLAIVIVVVLLFVAGVIGGGNPQPGSILDLAPDDANSIVWTDLERILANDFLADELFVEDDWKWAEDDLAIDFADLSEALLVYHDSGEIIVMKGDFDIEDLRDELEDQDAEENSYRGYEIWEDSDGGATALFDGYVVVSSKTKPVENVLKNLYGGSGSLANADEDNEMKQILDKVGSGFLVTAAVGNACRVERCEGYGWALTEGDESAEEAKVEIALLFRSERTAEQQADDYDQVADFLEQEGFDIEDTEADGNFVLGVAIHDLEEEESRAQAEAPRPTVSQAEAPQPAVSLSRSDWIDDCVRVDISIPNFAEGDRIDFHPSDGNYRKHCECVHDYMNSLYSPWVIPSVSDTVSQSLSIAFDVNAYEGAWVDMSGTGRGGPSVPYSDYLDDLFEADDFCYVSRDPS